MNYGWRLGSIAGIPVYLGRTWPIIAIVIVVTFGPSVPAPSGARGGVFGFSVALAYAVLLLLSVLAHEAAHAVVARGAGYRVDRVVADLWGGHTIYDSSTSRPGPSALIAVSGPAANLALAGLGFVLQGFAPDGVIGLLLGAVTYTNLFVGLFNLLPGLPLDGGYLVDALVWKVTGDRNRGLIAAGWLGRIVTIAVVLWLVGRPLLLGQQPSLFTIVWCGLIGAFLWVGATNAIRAGSSRRAIARVPLARVLRAAVVVPAAEPVASVLARVDGALAGMRGASPQDAAPVPGGGALGSGPAAVVLASGGQPMGLVDVAAARGVDPLRALQVPVEAVTSRQPDGWVVTVPSREADVSGIVTAVAARPDAAPATMVVVTPTGEVLGTVTLADLSAAFSG